MLDRPTVKQINSEINEALAAIAQKYKLAVKPVGCSFNAAEMGIRTTLQVVSSTGENLVDKKRWNTYAPLYGLTPEDFGREVVIMGNRFRLVSLNAKCKKYPFVAVRLRDGKRYKFDAWTIQNVLGKKTTPEIVL